MVTGTLARNIRSRRGKSHHRLGRQSGLLSLADGSVHLGLTWTDNTTTGQTHARSSFSDQWHSPRWATIHASASRFLRRRSGRGILHVLLRKISGKIVLISVAGIWFRCTMSLFEPKSAYDTKRRSTKAALVNVATRLVPLPEISNWLFVSPLSFLASL